MCRKILPVLAFLAPLVVVPGIYDPANLPQTAFVQAASICLLWFWLREGGTGPPKRSLDLPLALLLAWGWASLLWSTNRYEAFLALAQWTGCGLVYLVVSRAGLRDQDTDRLLSAFVAAAAVASLLGLGQQLVGFDWIPQAFPPAATFANKNLAAQFLVMVLPVAIHSFLIARSPWAEWGFAMAGGVIGAFLFHTAARSAWLAAVVSLGAAAAVACRSNVRLVGRLRAGTKPYAAAAAITLTLGLVMARTPQGQGLDHVPRLVRGALEGAYVPAGQAAPSIAEARYAAPPERQSVTLRLHVWSDSLEMIRANALLGVGAGNFRVHYPRFAAEGSAGIMDQRFQPEAVHNDYLQVACELGSLGMALLTWLSWRAFAAWREALHEPVEERRILAAGVGSGLLASCVDALFSFPLQRAIPPFVAALYAAILVTGQGRRSQADGIAPRLRQGLQIGTSALLLATLVWGGTQLVADRHVFRMVEAEERGDWISVVREGERAAAFNPFRTAPLFAVATAQLRLGSPAAAGAALERLLEDYPFSLNALGNLALAHVELGRMAEARTLFERVLARRPSDALSHYGLGRALEGMGQKWPALAALRRAAALDPGQPWISFHRGRLAAALGRRAEGVASLRQALALSPGWADVHARLGLALLEDPGSEIQAREHLAAALRLDPRRADAAKIRDLLARRDAGAPGR